MAETKPKVTTTKSVPAPRYMYGIDTVLAPNNLPLGTNTVLAPETESEAPVMPQGDASTTSAPSEIYSNTPRPITTGAPAPDAYPTSASPSSPVGTPVGAPVGTNTVLAPVGTNTVLAPDQIMPNANTNLFNPEANASRERIEAGRNAKEVQLQKDKLKSREQVHRGIGGAIISDENPLGYAGGSPFGSPMRFNSAPAITPQTMSPQTVGQGNTPNKDKRYVPDPAVFGGNTSVKSRI